MSPAAGGTGPQEARERQDRQARASNEARPEPGQAPPASSPGPAAMSRAGRREHPGELPAHVEVARVEIQALQEERRQLQGPPARPNHAAQTSKAPALGCEPGRWISGAVALMPIPPRPNERETNAAGPPDPACPQRTGRADRTSPGRLSTPVRPGERDEVSLPVVLSAGSRPSFRPRPSRRALAAPSVAVASIFRPREPYAGGRVGSWNPF